MISLIRALENTLEQQNWYASVLLALTLPDICGKIEYPEEQSSRTRYVDWCKRYLEPKYSSTIGPRYANPSRRTYHTFLSGSDCYALRCAILHEGSDDITRQRARESLEKFHFTAPHTSISATQNQVNKVLQLEVDKFAWDIMNSVVAWLTDIERDEEKQQRLEELFKIYHYDLYIF